MNQTAPELSYTPQPSYTRYKATIVLLILTIVILAAISAVVSMQTNSLLNDNKATITGLQTRILSLNQTISYLKTQLSGNVTLNAQLQLQITLLEKQLAALPKTDWITGTVTINPGTCGGITFFGIFLANICNPTGIQFTAASNGQLYSSVAKSGTYALWLLNETAYSPVTVIFTSTDFIGILSIQTCTAVPATFTPSTNPTSESFFC